MKSCLCCFLKSEEEIQVSSDWLRRNGYVSHKIGCKDWDLARIIPCLGDGNFLDMGSSDSCILQNLCIKKIRGEKFGIDLRPPDTSLEGVKYIVGDLTDTKLKSGFFRYITCLSVIEHGVNIPKFAREAARLLEKGGRIFITFDYWDPRINPRLKLYDLNWQPLDRKAANALILEFKKNGLHLVEKIDWRTGEPVGYCAPCPRMKYTFGMLTFEKSGKRILLGNLACYGDCLYATAIARQIKSDYPGCRLTWAIGSMYKDVLDRNPYVDEIWEVPLRCKGELFDAWQRFEVCARQRLKEGDFDEIFLPQVYPNNLQNFDGCCRSSLFRAYPRQITVPLAPIIRLSQDEVENVRLFAERNGLKDKKDVILFEYLCTSHQSFLTLELALAISKEVISACPDIAVVVSSHNSFTSLDKRIIDASVLSFRENAELTKYCSLLVGCSSGISWLATSDWAKPLPMIQLLRKNADMQASFVRDYERWGFSTDNIIEMYDSSVGRIAQCIISVLRCGVSGTRPAFHETVAPDFKIYDWALGNFLKRGEFKKAFRLFACNIEAHGPRLRFITGPLIKFVGRRLESLKNRIKM